MGKNSGSKNARNQREKAWEFVFLSVGNKGLVKFLLESYIILF